MKRFSLQGGTKGLLLSFNSATLRRCLKRWLSAGIPHRPNRRRDGGNAYVPRTYCIYTLHLLHMYPGSIAYIPCIFYLGQSLPMTN